MLVIKENHKLGFCLFNKKKVENKKVKLYRSLIWKECIKCKGNHFIISFSIVTVKNTLESTILLILTIIENIKMGNLLNFVSINIFALEIVLPFVCVCVF